MKILIHSFALLFLSSIETAHGQAQVTGFTLIDANANAQIGAIQNGDTIDLSTIGAQQLSMRADTSGSVGSVQLQLDGQTTATEGVAPYALGGDSGGNYNPVSGLLVTTSHTVVATIYSGSGGSGAVVDSLSITFDVTNSNSPPSPTGPGPTPAPAPAPTNGLHPDIVKVIDVEGENPGGLGWADSYSVGDKCYCKTNYDHGIRYIQVTTPLGPKTVEEVCNLLGPGPGYQGRPIYNDVQCGNGPANNAGDEDTCPGRVDIGPEGCGQIGPVWNFSPFTSPTSSSPTPAPVTTTDAPVVSPTTDAPVVSPPTDAPVASPPGVGSITSFTLINASTDNPIRQLTPGSVIDLSVDGSSLSMRADVSGTPIGSVKFGFDGNANFKTENVAPYALGGDNSGNYSPMSQLTQLGSHTVTATPFSETGAQGIQGSSLTLTFSVSNGNRRKALRKNV